MREFVEAEAEKKNADSTDGKTATTRIGRDQQGSTSLPPPQLCASMFTTVELIGHDRCALIPGTSIYKYTSNVYLLSTRSLRPLPLGRGIDRCRADHARRRQLAARRFRLATAAIRWILSLF